MLMLHSMSRSLKCLRPYAIARGKPVSEAVRSAYIRFYGTTQALGNTDENSRTPIKTFPIRERVREPLYPRIKQEKNAIEHLQFHERYRSLARNETKTSEEVVIRGMLDPVKLDDSYLCL